MLKSHTCTAPIDFKKLPPFHCPAYFYFRVNPITGYMDPSEKVSPFDGMTEEQKEYEAIKLVRNTKSSYSLGVIFYSLFPLL